MHEFPSPKDRISRILAAAPLEGSTYVSSNTEAGGSRLVLNAQSEDGGYVHMRFLGLKESEANTSPEPGSPLALKGVGSDNKFSLLRFIPFLSILKPAGPAYARVRIEAGAALLEIVCQDVEWWEDSAAQG